MYLTAQRVLSASGENGVNGFLYEHDAIAWETPPEVTVGGKLVHSFITVPPGGNKVLSFIDIVAPDGTSYSRICEQIFPWLDARSRERWQGVVADLRFGLDMISVYAKAWKFEVGKLITVCRMTFDRCTASSPKESVTP